MDIQAELLKAKILIVDDEEENVLLLETLLRSYGYNNLESTSDSTRALAIYEDIKPDLLLLDINMPIVDGYQIMDELGKIETKSYAPVLVLTASKDWESRLKALEKGAKDFLIKPFENTEALLRIHNMLEVRLLYNKLADQNLELESKVKERTKDLEESQLEIIHRLGRAVEYRDVATGSHVARVSQICAMMARQLGLSETQIKLIGDASVLHDIGKLGIPDSILLKPGPLEGKERSIIEKHSSFGADMLSDSKFELLKTSQVIALTHHEKWDGTGYPKGLKGEEIPLEGRICAIADVFDTVTSERLYKKAQSVMEGINEIRKGSGRAFDPALVEAFFEIIPQVKKLVEEK